MLKLLATVAVGALALSSTITAKAEMKDFARAGIWQASAGTDNGGERMCALSAMLQSGPYKGVHIKWWPSDGSTAVQIMSSGWRIPEGTKVQVKIGFDKDYWGGVDTALGGMIGKNKDTGIVTSRINPDVVADFMQNFSEANKMWITFPGGTEKPWFIDMTGSREMAGAFLNCMSSTPRPTQPFGKEPETSGTQPFGSPTQPSKKDRAA